MISHFKSDSVYVGIKQSRKALQEGKVAKAFVAEDADSHIIDAFVSECKATGVEVEYAKSKMQLGHSAGIERGAAVVVLLKN